MKSSAAFLASIALVAAVFRVEAKPLFSETFDAAATGAKLPAEVSVINGAFVVGEDGGQKFLELPGAPLDTFGVLFGPATPPPVSATGRIFGTKKGRKFPAFGIGVAGAGGFRLQVSAAKGALEIFKADTAVATVPYEWKSGAWTRLRVEIKSGANGLPVVRGKAWPDGSAEPAEWMISHEAPAKAPDGKASAWGNPFSGTPIRFDDLAVEPAS